MIETQLDLWLRIHGHDVKVSAAYMSKSANALWIHLSPYVFPYRAREVIEAATILSV
jgi:hypothetical protein